MPLKKGSPGNSSENRKEYFSIASAPQMSSAFGQKSARASTVEEGQNFLSL